MNHTSLFLAMGHEVRQESVDLAVQRLTGTQRDPYADVRLMLGRRYRVPAQRIERFLAFMDAQVREMAHREIARRYPEPTSIRTMVCPECCGSGVADYGYCARCGATGDAPLEVA